jgi:hypothetical protein
VNGVWLSENVIDQKKESCPPGSKSQQYSDIYGASILDELKSSRGTGIEASQKEI